MGQCIRYLQISRKPVVHLGGKTCDSFRREDLYNIFIEPGFSLKLASL